MSQLLFPRFVNPMKTENLSDKADCMPIRETNRMNAIRRDVLRHVAQAFMEEKGEDFGKRVERIPFVIRPKNSPSYRCCIYRDRAIVRFRCMAALGFRYESEEDDATPLAEYAARSLEREKPSSPILTVCEIACQGCVPARYFVTDACQGCIARPCMGACRFDAIPHVNGRSHIDPSKCRNCGKCHDVCPYQAIVHLTVPCESACPVRAIHKGKDGRAEIDEDKCISCGRCMRACPFGTIIERSEIVDVLRAIRERPHVSALIAPSIIGQFPASLGRIVTALRQLGFAEVLEVALGADVTSRREAAEFAERMGHGARFMTTSCCPSYVLAAKRHVPEILPFISETGTPMHYTAELAKQAVPETTTVFIGPCVAKRHEGLEDPLVDFVITFEELGALFSAAGIVPEECDEAELSRIPSDAGRGYAITGGVASAVQQVAAVSVAQDIEFSTIPGKNGAAASSEILPGVLSGSAPVTVRPISVNGLSLSGLRTLKRYATGDCPGNLVEVMTCEGGCVGGAGVLGDRDRTARAIASFANRKEQKS